MTVLAKTDAVILHIKKDLILKLCQLDTNFLSNLLISISDKTLILTDKIKALSMKTIRQCIIDFLIYESYSQSSRTVKLHLTKKELAEKFGIQRPSLSRELNKMRRDGLIEYDAHFITIMDLGSTYLDE
jgi:CRP-like cAMP-binding protein